MKVWPATFLTRFTAMGVFLPLLCFSTLKANQEEISLEVKIPKQISFLKTEIFSKRWRCLLHKPENYAEVEKLPLLIYLHGKGLRGDDLNALKRYGPPAFLDRQKDFPFVVVSPQLPSEEIWSTESLLPLVDKVVERYKIDPDRIYLSGVSLGAAGVWNLAAADQMKFAAMIPVCGYGDVKIAEFVDDIPIWGFHGSADQVTPVGAHQRLVDAVNAEHGDAKLEIIDGGTHGNIIFPTYNRKDIYDWLLSHDRVVKPHVKVRGVSPGSGSQPLPDMPLFKNHIPQADPLIGNGNKTDQQRPVGNDKREYVVKSGDTLWSISRANGITVDQLKRFNSLRSNVIHIGQELKIPRG